MRILVVDDNNAIRDFLVKFFKEKGYDVAEADNGLKALEIFGQLNCDLLWTDYEMPRMNGIELATRIRTIKENLPIILYSGNLPEDVDPKIINISLNKPAPLTLILETVDRLLKISS